MSSPDSAPPLRIERLASDGDGVAHLPDGRVIFVPLTAPGDLVRVGMVEQHKRYARGRCEELLEAGPARVEPRCSVFGVCGGCAWQHLDHAAQLEAKRQALRDALVRIGGLRLPGEIELLPSPAPYAYRGRARVHAEPGRIGFRQRASHALCEVGTCPVLVPELQAELADFARHPPRDAGEWELISATSGVRRTRLPAHGGAALQQSTHAGGLRLSPGVFVQGNALLLDALVERVAAAAGTGRAALELFAGAGLFSLALARRFERLVAVEGEPRAAADLRHNLAAAGCANSVAIAARVEDCAGRIGSPAPEVLVLDPPRDGIPAAALPWILALPLRRVVYLSCHPATLARDLRAFAARGFTLRSVACIDLFPQTPHVEALVRLDSAAA